MNKITVILLAAFLFLFGLVIGGWAIPKLSYCTCSYFELKTIDAIKLFVTIIIGFLVAYLINVKYKNFHKRIDIALDIISSFQDQIENTYENWLKYIKTPTDEDKDSVLLSIKQAGIHVASFDDLVEAKIITNKLGKSFHKEFFIPFKAALTDSPFGDDIAIYGDNERANASINYSTIMKGINKLKITIV